MASSGISFSGLGSGMDTEGIISQLTALKLRPITTMQTRKAELQKHQTAVNQVASAINSLKAVAATLDSSTGFAGCSGTSSDTAVATVSTQTGAQIGSFNLKVLQLAKAQRIASTEKASQTDALGVTGQILINGKPITVRETDTLQSLAASINNARTGATATIISTGANQYRMTLSAGSTGADNAITLSDVGGGTILSGTLGFLNGVSSNRYVTDTGEVQSALMTDAATSVGTLLGLTAPQSGTVKIAGQDVAIDLAQDSLGAIAAKINGASIAGVEASVVSETDSSGTTKQRLQISGTTTFADSNNVLANIGVLQAGATKQLTAACDASFEVDGMAATRSSNTVTDVVSGVTINLLKDTGTPSTDITISPDLTGIKSTINNFVTQYNNMAETVKSLSSYNADTKVGGPLLGDVSVQMAMNSVTELVNGQVSGLTGTTAVMSQIGITLSATTGKLEVNDATLTSALSERLSDVAKLFQAAGSIDDNTVTFVAATSKTAVSGTGGYAVNVTQLATQASVTSGTQHTADDNTGAEVLSFGGTAFGSGSKTILINAGTSLAGIASLINADESISAVLGASVADGRLVLTSKSYGTPGGFTVVSSQGAANNNSGIGSDTVTGTGLDVAGTINGEAATGRGQFLTGNTDNSTTEGLQLRITSATTGSKGNLVFTKGLARQMTEYATSATDILSGSLTSYSNSFTESMTEVDEQIARLQASVKSEQDRLRLMYSAMEGAVLRYKAAGSSLAGLSTTSA